MKNNCGKILMVTVKNAEVFCGGYETTSYIYNNKEMSFVKEFKICLPGLHGMLFDDFVILFYEKKINVFYKKKGKKLIGIVKIKLKEFLTDTFELERDFDMSDPSYLNKADFYDPNFESVGNARIGFLIMENVNRECNNEICNESFLRIILPKEKFELYQIAYNIFLATNRGTFFCRIYWFLGFLYTMYFHTYIYGRCDILRCIGKDNKCGGDLCRYTYGHLSYSEIKGAMRCLQYAAASFGDSIVTWNLEKVRSVKNVCEKRKRAILERLEDIPEENLVRDFSGGINSIGFIMFYEDERAVISFRGTHSVDEIIVDLNCDYTEFQENGFTHRGIKTLVDRWITENWEDIRVDIDTRNVRKLLLTGHSMGAAASVLTYLRLREMGFESIYDIHVVAFGSPPLVSKNIALMDFPKIKLYFYEFDFVTRLSYGSIQDLKYLCVSVSGTQDYFVSHESMINKIQNVKNYLKITQLYTKLYHVGHLVHIKTFKPDSKTSKKNKVVLFKTVNFEFFEDLIPSRNAPFDHFLYKTWNALKYALKELQEQEQQND